eukprot:4313832-Amphidinium_carterae.1
MSRSSVPLPCSASERAGIVPATTENQIKLTHIPQLQANAKSCYRQMGFRPEWEKDTINARRSIYMSNT